MGLNPDTRIFVAGHRGLVGAAIVRRLEREGFTRVVTRSRDELDLREQAAVRAFMAEQRPELVILAAAKVGGIHANATAPADFIVENLQIQTNVIDSAYRAGTRRLIFLGSSCIYPRECPQPIREEYLLTGPLEKTNEPYAVAKIAGLKQCEAYNRQYGTRFTVLMPTNLYGPGDNFNATGSHVIPGLMRRFHEAKANGDGEVVVWGTGAPRREFLHVDDLAEACRFVAGLDDGGIYNVGTGVDMPIRDLAELIREVVGYRGIIRFDPSMPDGTPRKLLDVTRLSALGWRPATDLRAGLEQTYAWFLAHRSELRL